MSGEFYRIDPEVIKIEAIDGSWRLEQYNRPMYGPNYCPMVDLWEISMYWDKEGKAFHKIYEFKRTQEELIEFAKKQHNRFLKKDGS